MPEPLTIIGERTGQAELMHRIQPEIERMQREHESFYARLRQDIYESEFFEDLTDGAIKSLDQLSTDPTHREALIALLEGEDFRQPVVRDVAVVYTAIAADLQQADQQGTIEVDDRRIREEGKEAIYGLINEYITQAIARVVGERGDGVTSPLATIVRPDGYIEIPTQHPVRALIEAIEHARPGEGWGDSDGERAPTHTTVTGKKSTEPGAVYVSVRGNDGTSSPTSEGLAKLWQQVYELNPLTSDVLIACLAACVHIGGPAWMNVDNFLDARGIKRIKKRGEPGNWQHGHRTEDRIAVGRAFGQLESLWIEMQNVEVAPSGKRRKGQRLTVESRAVAILDRVLQHDMEGGTVIRAARVALGGWATAYEDLGIKQLGLLAQKALEYDPHNNQPEKALTKYLMFQYRYNAGKSTIRRTVRELLHAAMIAPDDSRPKRAQQRLEKTLARLHKDGVLDSWKPLLDPADLGARGWFVQWLGSVIEIEAPPLVQERYAHLRTLRGGKPKANTA